MSPRRAMTVMELFEGVRFNRKTRLICGRIQMQSFEKAWHRALPYFALLQRARVCYVAGR
jgi:hypothetical protein